MSCACARDLFPDAADYDRGEYRACLRPMTPDGPPILGLGRHRNLFLNCGHGHMGWTMACGTARIVADLMTGRMPELDLEGLTVRPLTRAWLLRLVPVRWPPRDASAIAPTDRPRRRRRCRRRTGVLRARRCWR